MSFLYDPFAAAPAFELNDRIRARAVDCGIELPEESVEALAHHARAVLRENQQLHLTTITDPAEFLERHIGEALEGAAMLPADIAGPFLDLGSGNGYPGLVLGSARPGLATLLADASVRKTAFLRAVIQDAGFPKAAVLEAQIQRAADLEGDGPFRLITTRALGGWPKIVPRLRTCLAEGGDILVWAGEEVEKIARREVWKKLRLEEKRALPTREQSWIWRFRVA